MQNESVTGWIDQLSGGDEQAAEQLWQHISLRLQEYARRKLDVQTRRSYDEHDAANSAFHSLCRGLADGRIEAENRDARLQQLLRRELDWVVMRALEKDPNRRYQTLNHLAQDITNYLTGDTVTARPSSMWYQVQKFARRNRGLVAAMLAIGIKLLAGIAGTSYGLIRANQKTKFAEEKTDEAEEERGRAKASERLARLEKDKAQSNERRAVAAEQTASAEAARALGAEKLARDSEAAARFQLANARWETNRAGDARNLVHEIPNEYRGNFDWNFCNRHFQGSDMTC